MTNAIIIDGKAIAQKLRQEIARGVLQLKQNTSITPGLAVILVGEDPASKLYVKNKIIACKAVGINLLELYLEDSISEKKLINEIHQLNHNSNIHGILVQLPLPAHIDPIKVINAISPKKDVDGFTASNFGKLVTGQDCFIPCTPQGCLILIKTITQNLQGLNTLVIGRSNIVGKPMLHVLLRENCTVTIAHSYTTDLPELCQRADILIAAIGQANTIKGNWIKPGAIVIDVGINYNEKRGITGDVEFSKATQYAKAISPVPGGVGPMTVTCLLKNTLKAAL